MKEFEDLDILFLNLHRRYLNYQPDYGGFLGIYLLSAFLRAEGFESKGFAGSLTRGKKYLDEIQPQMVGLYCDYENVTENLFLRMSVRSKTSMGSRIRLPMEL